MNMLAYSLASSLWLICMCSANSVKCFHRNKATLSVIHYKQVLEGFAHIPPSLTMLSLLQLSFGSLLLVLWKTRPILISACHFHRNQCMPALHRAIETCVYCMCVCVYLFLCAHAHMLHCIHVSMCIWLPARVCTQGRRGGIVDWYCTCVSVCL